MTESRIPPPPALPFLRHARQMREAELEEVRRNPHLSRALEEEKREGHRIAVYTRTVALIIVGFLLLFFETGPEVLYYHAILALFIALGWAQLRVARVEQSGLELALIFLDLILLAVTLLVPNPFLTEERPTATQYQFEGFSYYYLLLAGGTLAYSWRTVMSFGTWVPIIWLSGMMLVIWFGTEMPELTQGMLAVLRDQEKLAPFYDPNNVIVAARIQEVIIFVLVAAILGLKSWRSSQLLMRQARIAAERANLSRYFPPNLVDDFATHDEPLGEVRSQEIAVMFVDIVGFTQLAERSAPKEVVDLLRTYHAMLEETVFDNGGTLDKYLGDGIMATFGTPRRGDSDATNALRAALVILDRTDEWNRQRQSDGAAPIRLSVGLHYGTVILGDIGTERRLEFAAIGDAVNVASRLEKASRELKCRLVVSDAVLDQIAAETPGSSDSRKQQLLASLRDRGQRKLRGRREQVAIHTA